MPQDGRSLVESICGTGQMRLADAFEDAPTVAHPANRARIAQGARSLDRGEILRPGRDVGQAGLPETEKAGNPNQTRGGIEAGPGVA